MVGIVRLVRWLVPVGGAAVVATVLLHDSLEQDRWTRQVRRSPFDRRMHASVVLTSDSMVHGWLLSATPQLVVACGDAADPQFSLYVVTDLDTKVEPGTARSVTFRFDDDEPVSEKWEQASNHQALAAPPDRVPNLINRLSSARRFNIAFVPFHADTAEAIFSVAGFANRWQALRAECGSI